MAKDAQGHGSETGGGNRNHGKSGRFDSGSSGSGRSKKLNPHDQKIANNLARSVGKAAVNNARARRKAQDHGVEPRSASAAKLPGFGSSSGGSGRSSGTGGGGNNSSGGGGGSHGSGAGSNPSRMGSGANKDARASGNPQTGTTTTRENGVNVTRFNNGNDQQPVHVRLSPAAREQIAKLKAMDNDGRHSKGSNPDAVKQAKYLAASHGVHSTGVTAIPRGMGMQSRASAHPGESAGTGDLPRNSSDKFSGRGGVPKDKRRTLSYGDGTKL